MKKRRPRRILRTVGILPSLLTLGNALSGFGAIAYAVTERWGQAAWCIFLAMAFDALDGKVARLTGQATKFGEHLDSLSDAISFGVAPALIGWCLLVLHPGRFLPQNVVWLCCALYLGCAVLRLARFNVETSQEEDSHQTFAGLPSPAAAGFLASFVLVYVKWGGGTSVVDPTRARLFLGAYPFALVLLGVLMVSRLSYAHVLIYFQRQRSFRTLVTFVLALVLVALLEEVSFLAIFLGYTCLGPVDSLRRRLLAAPETATAGPSLAPPPEEKVTPADTGS